MTIFFVFCLEAYYSSLFRNGNVCNERTFITEAGYTLRKVQTPMTIDVDARSSKSNLRPKPTKFIQLLFA